MKKIIPSINNYQLISILACMLLFTLISCSKNKDGLPDEKKAVTAAELEDYYIVTENSGWTPLMGVIYFQAQDGKTVVTYDGAGLRRGFDTNIVDNTLNIASDNQSFEFVFEKSDDGKVKLTAYSGSASYAALYKNTESFPVAGKLFSRYWEQVPGVLYHISFNDSKFIDGTAGIDPQNGYSYYTVGNKIGWKSETSHGNFMGVTVPTWKGNGKKTLLVENRSGSNPKIDIYN